MPKYLEQYSLCFINFSILVFFNLFIEFLHSKFEAIFVFSSHENETISMGLKVKYNNLYFELKFSMHEYQIQMCAY